MEFKDWERAVLAMAQGDLPDSLAPFADMAARAGVEERQVIDFLKNLRERGAIRRFGASLRHQRAGWSANAMVAWRATPAEAEKCGQLAAENPNVSHAYYRPCAAPDYPYSFYTMVHARDENALAAIIASLAAAFGLKDYAVLRTLRELKKTSMTYFA